MHEVIQGGLRRQHARRLRDALRYTLHAKSQCSTGVGGGLVLALPWTACGGPRLVEDVYGRCGSLVVRSSSHGAQRRRCVEPRRRCRPQRTMDQRVALRPVQRGPGVSRAKARAGAAASAAAEPEHRGDSEWWLCSRASERGVGCRLAPPRGTWSHFGAALRRSPLGALWAVESCCKRPNSGVFRNTPPAAEHADKCPSRIRSKGRCI